MNGQSIAPRCGALPSIGTPRRAPKQEYADLQYTIRSNRIISIANDAQLAGIDILAAFGETKNEATQISGFHLHVVPGMLPAPVILE